MKTKDGNKLPVLVPDASTHSFLERKKGYSYLKLFAAVAINQVHKKSIEVSEDKKIDDIRKIMMGIDQQMTSLGQFEKSATKLFIQILNRKNNRRIRSYKREEIFLGYFTAMLNCLYSLKELTQSIDKALANDFSKEIWDRQQIDHQIRIRNLLIHEGVPLVNLSKSEVMLSFSRNSVMATSAKLLLKFAKSKTSKNIDFVFRRPVVTHFVVNAHMNTWAKKHLEAFDQNQTIAVTKSIQSDGRVNQIQLPLKELIKHAEKAPLYLGQKSSN